MDETKHRFNEEDENRLNKLVWEEYQTSERNQKPSFADFEANLDIVECKRTEKNYDWMSDVFIPEAPSIFLTEASHESSQYFSNRDFVDVYLETADPPDVVSSAKVAKKTINQALNNKEIRHYQKYMQAREINRLAGYVYAVCWWEQDIKQVQTGVDRYLEAETDENGQMMMGEFGEPAYREVEKPIFKDAVLTDRFNWMPIDPRNVFTNNRYTYSAQEEDFIIIRSEKTYQELKDLQASNNFFNLELLKDWKQLSETETSQKTYNQDEKAEKIETNRFDILERYGRLWAIVKERDKYGYPTVAEPGYDEEGNPKKDAEFILVRQAVAYKGSTKVLIRFQAEPLRDGMGRPYMPVIRGISYVHPTKKHGMSDAKYIRELQVAANDTINLSNDRVKLATLPTFIGNKYMMENNDTIFMEPEHVITLENPAPDNFRELKISSDIQGALSEYNLFRGAMQQIASVYPNTMGNPGSPDVTATAIAGADTRSNIRNNYKSLTIEHTLLNDQYWMILQMTWQFMHQQTIMKNYTSAEVQVFNPVGDYTYQPITSNIEAQHSKDAKVRNYDQIVGRLSGLAQGNPAIIPVIAYVVGRQLELMGDEFRAVEPLIKKLMGTPMKPEEGELVPTDKAMQVQDQGPEMTQNQGGTPVSQLEQYTRGAIQ